jgi:hypothetical protein
MKSTVLPDQIDQVWKEIIRLTEVPHAPGLFVLGSFARRVTVYSQQLRALNLADALAGLGFLRRETRVAVVGAGFAGLTMSAALAKMGASVTIFDRYNVLAGLQNSCKTRYLHPHIYDWPSKRIQDVAAGLPFLSWAAGNADDVVAAVADEWRAMATDHGIVEHFGREVRELQQAHGQWEVRLDGQEHPECFELVILAVGFGVEKPDRREKSYSYWADLPLKHELVQKKLWLVSGAGDGALTDVMQLCVRHNDQETTLHAVAQALEQTVPGEVIARLQNKVARGAGGRELFDEIDPIKLAGKLELREKPIYLNASAESVFGTTQRAPLSSTLNRLVVWMLEKADKVRLEEGRIPADGITSTGEGLSVVLERSDKTRRSIQCEDVLLRHGPEAILPGVAWLSPWSRRLRRLKRQWQKLYDSGGADVTLHDRCAASVFDPRRLSPPKAAFGALLLYSKGAFQKEQDIAALKASFHNLLTRNRVKASLAEAVGGGGRPLEGIEVASGETLIDPRSFGAAVQALCHAPLAIVDGTHISSALALLLGIRAAVRRGVTIVFHKGNVDMKAWQQLPFNLREVRLVTVTDHRTETGFRSPITVAIEEGFRRLAMSPARYGDLPGFATLRNLGVSEEENAPRPGKTELLVLCPFDEAYDENWIRLRDALHGHFFPGEQGDQPATRVVDMSSPEMLSKRLFEAIRRDEECVVDLSLNKVNVLFELGTRIAVHERGARITRSSASALDAEGELMGQMLGVGTYNTDEKSVIDALAMGKAVWPGGAVSASFVYSIAERCAVADQEAGGHGMLDVLWDLLASVGGADRQKQAAAPILFRGNHVIRRNAHQFFFNGLVAYCLLAQRLPVTDRTKSRIETAVVELRNTLRDLSLSEEERKQWNELLNGFYKTSEANTSDSESFLELAARAKRERTGVKETREKWKASAVTQERETDFQLAVAQLQSLALTLETARNACETRSLRERDLCAQLSESYGALGGLYRDWDKLPEAVTAYQKGRGYEKRIKDSGGLSGSYCLVQALVNQVLLESRSSNPLVKFKESFQEARQELINQLNDDRRGDPWLQADIALVTQLLDSDQATEEWEAFEDLQPPNHAYSCAGTVMKTLFEALKPYLSPEKAAAWTAALLVLE